MLLSILPLSSSLTLPILYKPHFLPIHTIPFLKSQKCFAFSPSNPISEESRLLREEQRWLREEQRWLREESRWSGERQALLQEISSLQLRIEELERLNSFQDASVSQIINTAKLLLLKEGDLKKDVNIIAESESYPVTLVVEAAKPDEEIIHNEVITISDKKEIVKKSATLRMGSKGDEIQQKCVTKESFTEISITENRVFLLGENRWEEPSRLSASKRDRGSGNITTRCASCHGAGILSCMECEGTGEINVEEQFMEWVDEGAKCPYCEGLGYTKCYLCGRTK